MSQRYKMYTYTLLEVFHKELDQRELETIRYRCISQLYMLMAIPFGRVISVFSGSTRKRMP